MAASTNGVNGSSDVERDIDAGRMIFRWETFTEVLVDALTKPWQTLSLVKATA